MISIKTAEEIEAMREPCAITRDVLDLLGRSLREGMTTAELDRIAFEFIKDCGAEPAFLGYCGYPASACISLDDMVVHGIPNDKQVIKEGVIVSIDVGAVKNGFVGDAARSFYVGDISAEKKKLIDVTRECFFEGIKYAREGNHLFDISSAIGRYAESFGYGVVRDLCGHGIGNALHEAPEIPNYAMNRKGVLLKAGMTLAIEPMINIGGWEVDWMDDDWTVVTRDHSLSAHYENTVLITESDPVLLSGQNEHQEDV